VPAEETAVKNNWIAVSLILAAPLAAAQDGTPLSKEQLAGILKGVEVGNISDSAVPGIYQVAVGAEVAYVTSDGRYLLEGELYDLKTNSNLTEQTREKARVDLLASVDPATMIVFGPENGEVKHTITIFTDVDCGYCRQFHRDIAEVNALGIEVHYLFYPRTGRDTESWAKAEKVWCSPDRNAALTRAKLGGSLPDVTCGETPVAAHYDLGHRMGLRGTPAIYSSTGEHLGGYLTPATLIRVLDESAQ
jgi:thiol:disulfide interchange protein DsbC